MTKILEYYNCKNIVNLNKSEEFKKDVQQLEKHQNCTITKYGITGDFITLYSNTDVFRWGLTKTSKPTVIICGHGKLHSLVDRPMNEDPVLKIMMNHRVKENQYQYVIFWMQAKKKAYKIMDVETAEKYAAHIMATPTAPIDLINEIRTFEKVEMKDIEIPLPF